MIILVILVKMIGLDLSSALSGKFHIEDMNVFIINLIIAAVLVIVGVILGMFIKYLGRKTIEKSGIGKNAKKSFVDLFLVVIKWSIYILFISLALNQLGIPQITSWLTNILVVIPAFVGALILILVGFGIAVYLKDLIDELNILEKKVLSTLFFYFTIFVFMIFAVKTALISLDKNTVNLLVLILTGIVFAGLVYWQVRKKETK